MIHLKLFVIFILGATAIEPVVALPKIFSGKSYFFGRLGPPLKPSPPLKPNPPLMPNPPLVPNPSFKLELHYQNSIQQLQNTLGKDLQVEGYKEQEIKDVLHAKL